MSLEDATREVEWLSAFGAATSRLAHDVNNPLGIIHNGFLLLRDAIPASHPHYRYVATIDQEIRRIAAAMQRLAEAYNPARDRATGVPVSAIVADAVAGAVAARGVDPDAIVVDQSSHEAFPAPAGLLRHALQPLIEAALRVKPAGVSLVVSSRRDRDLIVIVADAPGSAPLDRADLRLAERLIENVLHGVVAGSAWNDGDELVALALPLQATIPGYP